MGDILFATLLIIPLAYGAIMDCKHRTIPNGVCIIILMVGLLGAVLLPQGSFCFIPLWQRAIGLFPAAFMLLIAYFKNGIGGGDIKLMAALGFAVGVYTLVPVLLVATVTAVIWAIRQKEKSVPLGVFLFIGYTLCYFLS